MSATTQTQAIQKAMDCTKHGPYTAHGFQLGAGDPILTCCPTCRDERLADDAANAARQQLARRRRAACIPARYDGKLLSDYDAHTDEQRAVRLAAREYAEGFRGVRASGRCLVLLGLPGTGKTHIACGIAQQVLEMGFSVRFTSAAEMLDRIRATFSRGHNETKLQALDHYIGPDLLVLDDVGASHGTEAEQVILTDVLSARYHANRPVVLTTNLDLDGLKACLGARAYDRLRENRGRAMPFRWDSHRGNNTNKGEEDRQA